MNHRASFTPCRLSQQNVKHKLLEIKRRHAQEGAESIINLLRDVWDRMTISQVEPAHTYTRVSV